MRLIDADALIEFCAERWIPLNIDAVNMQPTIQPVATDTDVGDTISRQAAIDAAREWYDGLICGSINGLIKRIKALPPAQPEQLERCPIYDGVCGYPSDQCYDCPRHHGVQPEPHWIPVSERVPSKEERKEWIDNNLDGIGYLYPCLVTRYSSINPDRTKNNPYVAKHYYDGEDFLNAGEEVCSEYIIAWMPLPEPYQKGATT